jgi:putative nucleotidyltransferase with HDIG domain
LKKVILDNRKSRGLLGALVKTLDLHDPYTQDHSYRVTDFAGKLAKRLGLSKKQMDLISEGSQLHDIGKFGISKTILHKPGKLTSEEYEIIKTHPILGATMLENFPDLHSLIPIVRHHHEFFNGHGYPDKIVGNQIEVEARIISVADAVDAMSYARPYRPAYSTEQIMDELQGCANTQFDPLVAETAIRILKGARTSSVLFRNTLPDAWS